MLPLAIRSLNRTGDGPHPFTVQTCWPPASPSSLVGPQSGQGGSMSRDDDAVSAIRARLPAQSGPRDHVRFGTLAASSHKSQPWKCRLGAHH